MSRATVADVLVDGLVRAGTPRVFGAAGAGASESLPEAARQRRLEVVWVEGTAAACIMAAVTGELAGAPGAVLAGSGPELESAIPGIAHARHDRAPLIALTEGAPRARNLLAPLTKASLGVDPASAGPAVAQASRLALAAPRGPVHLDLAAGAARRSALGVATTAPPAPLPPPDARALDAAARVLVAAARPVIVAGAQCRAAEGAKWLWPFAEAVPAPVLVTCKAKGVLPDRHPLNLGLMAEEETAGALLARADLIVTLGVEAVEVHGWPVGANVLHVGEAPPAGAPYRPVAQVVGEIGLVIAELAPRLRGCVRADWDVAELDRLKRSRRPHQAVPGPGLSFRRAAEIARQMAAGGTIAVVDAGEEMLAVAAAWDADAPNEFLASNRLATTGFALPAAIAAQLAHRERRVVCFTGPPGLAEMAPELGTAARLALPIVVVVLSAAALAVSAEGAARRAGLAVATAGDEEALREALQRALESRAPALVGARVRSTV
jgi:acetolactate synthase-1/2/3 large subunit